MKRFTRFSKVVTAFTALAILVFGISPVFAASEGQIDGGDIYRIQNITQKVGFTDPAAANACDVLEYKARLYDPGPGALTNVMVSATLPTTAATSNTSTLTASSQNADPSSTTATTTLNLTSSQTASYVNGTTQLLDTNGNLIQNLPDGITQNGVSIGNLAASGTEFVQFQVQVSCPPVLAPPVYTCNQLSVTTTASTREVQADVTYTAQNGATFQNVTYNFGDGSAPITTTNTTETYNYTKYGTFPVTATVAFGVNGGTQTASSTNCAKTVSFVAPTTPSTPAAPTTPAQLPNTGAGDVIGIFGVTTVVGAVVHRLFAGRHLLARLNG